MQWSPSGSKLLSFILLYAAELIVADSTLIGGSTSFLIGQQLRQCRFVLGFLAAFFRQIGIAPSRRRRAHHLASSSLHRRHCTERLRFFLLRHWKPFLMNSFTRNRT